MHADLALSRLLSYPSAYLLANEARTRAICEDAPRAAREPLVRYFAKVHGLDEPERQRLYVDTFDSDRRANLHLTAHADDGPRQHVGRLTDLKLRFRVAGFALTSGESPDHLAVLIELRALAPIQGASALAELRPAIESIRARLHEVNSPYQHVLDAFCATLPRLARE